MLKIVVVAVVLIQNLDAQTPSGLQIACNAAETIQRDISRMMTYLTLNTENFGRYISNVTNYINSNLERMVVNAFRIAGRLFFPFRSLATRSKREIPQDDSFGNREQRSTLLFRKKLINQD
ncbi:uncharacterized protein LOC123016343 isoform X1 [Tribolium madens]|uniref:uncharacterized protein LOC123016343 isoform X1 n=1 Tax=Tribolium madens TaxID=41895 RepID=UPI001CF724A2|nr:uncharacterized protein LOC123016343 isoform X1 [Tribolium madens]